ncbi:MAG: PD-(D/E)XK nuclease family protein, partial [Clostridia bacterium]|nr:PD-(D/E)XK nuclease family protein [Clostridia bacterium]
AEEARVLYVALTRARDRLVLVGSVSELADRRLAWELDAPGPGEPIPQGAFFAARTYLDWVVPAALAEAEAGEPPWSLTFHAAEELEAHFDGARGPGGAEPPGARPAGPAAASGQAPVGEGDAGGEGELDRRTAELAARLTFAYPYGALADRPAKRAASDWEWPADPGGEEAAPLGEAKPARGGASVRPRPLASGGSGEPTGAEVGTALHLVFEHLPLVPGRPPGEAEVRATLERLRELGYVREAAAGAVDPAWVTSFFASEVGRRILAHPEDVRREWMFTLGLGASEAYPGVVAAPDDLVVVQGVVDLLAGPRAYEGGEPGWLLVDFKTDREPAGGAAELLRRHEGQVRTYARAVREITGVPVREAYLYLAALGEVVPVGLGAAGAASS